MAKHEKTLRGGTGWAKEATQLLLLVGPHLSKSSSSTTSARPTIDMKFKQKTGLIWIDLIAFIAHPHVLCWSHSSKGQLQVGGGLIGKKSASVSSFIDIRQRSFSLNWLNEGRGCALHQIWSHFMPRLFGGNTSPPLPPLLVQSRQIKWAEQFLQGLAMSKGPNRPTLNPTQMKITKSQNSVHNVSRRQTVFSIYNNHPILHGL